MTAAFLDCEPIETASLTGTYDVVLMNGCLLRVRIRLRGGGQPTTGVMLRISASCGMVI